MHTATLPRVLESQTQVRFPDCDPFNHLNNTKYIEYIINAREDQLIRYYDFDIHKMVKETGLSWVVGQTQIAYLIPAGIMEVVTIETRVINYNTKTLVIEAVMWNKDKTHIKAIMWSRQAHYNLKTRKSQEHSEELMSFFNEVQNPIEGNPTFEDRVKQLRQINGRP